MADTRWDRRGEVAGIPLFWRDARELGGDSAAPVLYLHGVPTNSDDFLPFLERTGGVALDMPGFGRSGKPAAFDYSIEGYARFLERFLDAVVADEPGGRFSLVLHDWGAVGLALSDAALARLERVVVVNAVPLAPGYRWHRIARLWRTPLIGELTMGFSTRWGFKRLSRRSTPSGEPLPDELIDSVWDHFDHGTQRAILKLYRSAPPEALAVAGERLSAVGAPALVVWGALDPYIPASFAEAYADAFGGVAEVELLGDAGHWPWIDRPETIDAVARFVASRP